MSNRAAEKSCRGTAPRQEAEAIRPTGQNGPQAACEPEPAVRPLRRFNRGVGKVVNAIEVSILVVCVAALGILLIANVFARTFFESIYYAEEVSTFLVMLVTFTGVSYGVRKARHIRMGAFLDAMPPKMEKVFIIFISLVSAAVMAIMSWASWEYLRNAMDMGHMTPALRVPKWTFYMIIPLGFGMACIQYIRTIIKNLIEKEPWQSPDQQSEYEDEEIGEVPQ